MLYTAVQPPPNLPATIPLPPSYQEGGVVRESEGTPLRLPGREAAPPCTLFRPASSDRAAAFLRNTYNKLVHPSIVPLERQMLRLRPFNDR